MKDATPLPCPFCGHSASPVERANPLSKWRWSVDCDSTTCGASGPVEANAPAAVWAWNERAALRNAAQQAEGEGE